MSLVPTYIYKIVPSSTPPPSPLPDALPVSELDKSDGFIHLSTAAQLPATLGRFFQKDELVYILRIIYKQVEKDIKWEDSKGKSPGGVGKPNIFPHLYNGLCVGKEEVESVAEWTKDAAGSWDSAINNSKEESWFVY